ncbi:PREDICTED: GPI mannosyltransferase 4 [Gavialis gangeticus]|uniref:GPI mannosyltransferase 4 n=1 Tax=Gavialis gangeticus TaxID=94835 RepID=UPI00092F5057|nr:PREDICTED: GPI mannosyltransferase 4 [Gavialis gangeticus]
MSDHLPKCITYFSSLYLSPSLGDILDLQVYYPWEFLSSSPCRTVVFPLITSGVTYWVIKFLQQLGIWPNCINSYTLLVAPRLLLTTFSFILDYTVYRLAPFWGADRWNALILLAGSYITLVFFTRTFTNTLEGLLFALLMLLASARESDTSLAKHTRSSLIGIITAAGFFNRPTFLAFALMPLLYWTGLNITPRHSIRAIAKHFLKLVPSATLTAFIFVAADTLYFTSFQSEASSNSTEKVKPFSITAIVNQNIIVTPFNFLSYNLNPHNLAQHGSHPRVTHFAVNGLILFGILHILAISIGLKMLRRCVHPLSWIKLHGHQSSTVLVHPESKLALLSFYFVPLVFLSLFSHQEPRFLIPLILPLVLLITSHNRTIKWKPIIIIFNVLGAFVFGCLHQGGLIPCLAHLEQLIHSPESLSHGAHYTLLFAHTYMPPRFLLNISKKDPQIEVIDMAGTELQTFCQTLEHLANTCGGTQTERKPACKLFVITPGTIGTNVKECGVLFKNETLIFPHLTMEDPPQLSFLFSDKWKSQLGLSILQLDRNQQSI